MMRNGSVFHSDCPPYYWKRVYSITRELLPYDDDEAMVSERANNSVTPVYGLPETKLGIAPEPRASVSQLTTVFFSSEIECQLWVISGH
jgi:hypothetical protein